MRTIELTQGKQALVDDEDYELLMNYKWHAWQASKNGDIWYAATYFYLGNDYGRNIDMHRLLLDLDGTKLSVDHINGDGLDNRRCNLRVANQQQNMMNRRKGSKQTSSKYKGVYRKKHTHLWRAHIQYNRKDIHIGYFKDEEDAARAYDQKAIELFKEFANLNFKEGR